MHCKPFRHEITISTKFTPAVLPGQENPEGKFSRIGIRQAVEGSLRRLQTDYIDLYTEHRVPKEHDPSEVAYWMGELINEGKIRAWGQSEPTLEQLKAAHAVTPITAVAHSEYSSKSKHRSGRRTSFPIARLKASALSLIRRTVQAAF